MALLQANRPRQFSSKIHKKSLFSLKMSVTQINAADAFDFLKKDKNSVLVDVRTFEEFNFVGTVNPAEFDGRMILSPWKLTLEMKENPAFAAILEEGLKKLFGSETNETKILFLCRTGGRSDAAARLMSSLGYANCYNILSGFEGDLNLSGQRGTINGWKAEKLPWKQS
jgi:rhodanese-related sulfurtransferase